MRPGEYERDKVRRKERGIAPRVVRYASYLVQKAVSKGILPPARDLVCVDCGGSKKNGTMVYDHRFYSRPLDVEPVCGSCNKKRGAAYDLEMICEDARSPNHAPCLLLPQVEGVGFTPAGSSSPAGFLSSIGLHEKNFPVQQTCNATCNSSGDL